MADTPQIGSVVTLKELSNEKFVIGKILRGGMGEVYQLISVRPTGAVLALKTYQPTATREQFIREADHWISLGNHAHIARAILYLDWESRPSIIANWYKQSIDSEAVRTWPTGKLVNFTAGLLDGLEYAFRVGGIIHQDVKPANILLDDGDEPRLSDFGMARFAHSRPGIAGLEGVDPSMIHSVSLGPIGGTPFYMAPELFLGMPPSVQTDIFSVGVTLYQLVTGEHPYCGPETGHRARPVFRSGPLRLFEQKRGSEAAALVFLIVSSLQLDPRKRPKSYEVLFQVIGREYAGNQTNASERVHDVITKAAFLRDTRRTQDALELLQTAINDRPTSPELLNSLAIQLLRLGLKERAYAAWDSAVECLRFTNGRHNRALYLDPAINLAWRMVSEQQFAKADSLFTSAAQWTGDTPSVRLFYMQFGWWHLYHGRFERAWQHILTCSKSKTPDEMSVWCFTLAAWLSGEFAARADTLAKAYLALRNRGATTALLACTLAKFVPARRKEELHALAYPEFDSELAGRVNEMGLTAAGSLQSLSEANVRLVVRSLDSLVTGGRNSELI